MLSDWENKKCDWATNSTIVEYYTGEKIGKYRVQYFQNFINDLVKKKELRVGIDYYALMYVCKDMIPVEILQYRQQQLRDGEVFVYTVTLVDTIMYWRGNE